MVSGSVTNLKKRSLMIQLIRDFFTARGFLEVETPVRSPAIIPEAHIDPITADDQFLMASPEIYMKRLLARGIPKIFQICKAFRKNERGERHLPELTLLEWYSAGDTYTDLMDHCQDLIRFIAHGLGGRDRIRYQDHCLDLSQPFERLTVHRAFTRHTGTSCDRALAEGRFDDIMAFDIEPHLGLNRPLFLLDYPAAQASLARIHPRDNRVAQRFELYMAGIELANGFTELTDGTVQRQRFEAENRIRTSRGQAPLPLPDKFLSDLSAMPDAAGIALGVDRLAMLFCNADSIDEVVAFVPESC